MPFDVKWMVQDFKKYLARECDFVQEADNAKRVATMFENNSSVLVMIDIAEAPYTSERHRCTIMSSELSMSYLFHRSPKSYAI